MDDTINENSFPQINMSNTKKEMLDVYRDMKKLIEAKDKELIDAERAKKELEKKAALAEAETQAAQDPVHRIHDLRSSLNKELSSLAEKFEEELETYRKVQAAVKEKQEELKSVYDIEAAASDLAALIQSQQVKKEKFDQEMADQKSDFDEEMSQLRENWAKEQADRAARLKEEKEELKKQKEREESDYEYNLNREREQRRNKLEDELQALQKEITQKKETFEQDLITRETTLKARETEVTQKEKEFERLSKEVDSFPSRLEAGVKAAVDEATSRLTADFGKTEALLKANFEGEKNVLLSKIESLEKLVQGQAEQIAGLSRRQEQAYEKVQDIANKAISSAHRDIISIPYGAQQQPTDKKD
ncbi:MAG: hypothetical protein SVW57_06785 [Thermodesulfobacteriota bacterium]|nr:hypothetical protein [Thermodesulfobacteriota bacterium]